MKISAKAKFLVRNIVLENVTYLEVMDSKAVKEDDTLAAQIDAYIKEQGLEIDKTV
ncbi:MAG: hypothetical protein IKB07_08135 [Lachnospiraceae bacterium]|nr:hypothetical protein [Lachnospiraceae bacterium]